MNFEIKSEIITENSKEVEEKDNLFCYGEEKYKEFLEKTPDSRISIIINKAKNEFNEEEIIKNNLGIEERIENFSQEDKDIEIEEILKKNSCDLTQSKSVIKQVIFWELSREKSIESRKNEKIPIEGFEKDPDFEELEKFLLDFFKKDLLDKCFISEINYHPEIVFISKSGTSFLMPIDKYREWKNKFPKISNYVARGSNLNSYNTPYNEAKKLTHFPIDIYSFEDTDLKSFEYLENIKEDEKMKSYKKGIVSHEIGHNIYSHLMSSEMRSEWESIMKEIGKSITSYTEKYRNGVFGNSFDFKEEFCEAVKLKSICPEYLSENFPEANDFLEKHFPEMKLAGK
jgi:hypothetical protein